MEHLHIVVWIDNKFYCLSCGKQLTGEEAKTALATCEDCGKEFKPEDGTFELGEYSYCGDCCHW